MSITNISAASFNVTVKQNFQGHQLTLMISSNNSVNNLGDIAEYFDIIVKSATNTGEYLFNEDKPTSESKTVKVALDNISGSTDYNGNLYENDELYTIIVTALDQDFLEVSSNEISQTTVRYYSPPNNFTTVASHSSEQLIVEVNNVNTQEPLIKTFRVSGYNIHNASESFIKYIQRIDTNSNYQKLIGENLNNPSPSPWTNGETWKINVIGYSDSGSTFTSSDTTTIQVAPNDPLITITTPILEEVTNGPQFSLKMLDTNPIIENGSTTLTESQITITQDNSSVILVFDLDNSSNWPVADASYVINTDQTSLLSMILGPNITDNSNNILQLNSNSLVTVAIKNSNLIDGSTNTMIYSESSFNLIDGTVDESSQVISYTDSSFIPVDDNIPTINGNLNVVQPLNTVSSIINFSYSATTTAMPKQLVTLNADDFVQPSKWTIEASVDDFQTTGIYVLDLSNNPPSEYTFDNSGVGTLNPIILTATDFSLNIFETNDFLQLRSFLSIPLDNGLTRNGTVVSNIDLSGNRNDDALGVVIGVSLEFPFTPNAPTFTIINPAANLNNSSLPQFTIDISNSDPITDDNGVIDISSVELTVTQGSNSATIILPNTGQYTLGPDICGNIVAFTLVAGLDVSLNCILINDTSLGPSPPTTVFTVNGVQNQTSFIPQINPTFSSLVTDTTLVNIITDGDVIDKTQITVNLASGFTDASALSDLYNANGISDINLTIATLDASSNTVIDSSGVTDLSENVILDVSGTPRQIKLRLTASGNDNAGNPWTSQVITTNAINIINNKLDISSINVTQPSKGDTIIMATMTIESTDDNTTNYHSATASLYVNKNNDPTKPLNLSNISLSNNIQVNSVNAVNTEGNTYTFTFNLQNQAQYLRGQQLYVVATMYSLGTDNTFTTTASTNPIYLYSSPSLSYNSGANQINITQNGYILSNCFGIDNDNSNGNLSLDLIFFDSESQTGSVVNNDNYNYIFDNNGIDNTITQHPIILSIGSNYENITTIIIHFTLHDINLLGDDEIIVKGAALY